MDLNQIPNIRKGKYYSHEIDTDFGALQITLNRNHLCCNFIGNEVKAKVVFGHWKVNKFVYSQQDILNHLKYIEDTISTYKSDLKNGMVTQTYK